MVIELLLEIVYGLFNILTSPIDIPSLPSEVHTYIDTLIEYVGVGIGFLSNYTHIGYLLSLFAIILAVDIGISLYNIVMWVLKKIPVLGIE